MKLSEFLGNEGLRDDAVIMTKKTNQEKQQLTRTNDDDMSSREMTIRDVHETFGVLKQANFISAANRAGALSQLARIQAGYRRKDSELLDYAPSFPAFCEHIGVEYHTIREHLRNLHAFGEEFLSSAESLGIPVRDLRMIKRLPDKDREKVIRAVASGEISEKDEVRDVIMDLVDENKALSGHLQESQMKEKVDLIKERDARENEAEIVRSMLRDEEAKSERLRQKVKDLLASRQPDRMSQAIATLTARMSSIAESLSGADLQSVDDPILNARLGELRAFVQKVNELIS